MAVRLRLPASPALDRANAMIHWLKRPGDVIHANEAVALLGARTELRAPTSPAGRVEKLLAGEGERVINRQPLLRITVLTAEPAGPPGLTEPPAVPFQEELRARMVMEPVDQPTHRALAVVGGIAAVGIAIAALCLPVYLFLGGPTVPAIGGGSLMVVAAALAYGRHVLRQGNG